VAAIQIANGLHARPIALTRTSAKRKALLAQGAAAVIATAEEDIVNTVNTLTDGSGADLVFDPVGGTTFATLAKATAAGRKLILYGALSPEPTVVPPFDVFARGLTICGFSLTALTRDDARLCALKQFVSQGLDSGALRPVIAHTLPFDRLADAHRLMESGDNVGKIVVTVPAPV
jgi:NADPH:quinone reductase-like Zn-dependent oxidoreductase